MIEGKDRPELRLHLPWKKFTSGVRELVLPNQQRSGQDCAEKEEYQDCAY